MLKILPGKRGKFRLGTGRSIRCDGVVRHREVFDSQRVSEASNIKCFLPADPKKIILTRQEICGINEPIPIGSPHMLNTAHCILSSCLKLSAGTEGDCQFFRRTELLIGPFFSFQPGNEPTRLIEALPGNKGTYESINWIPDAEEEFLSYWNGIKVPIVVMKNHSEGRLVLNFHERRPHGRSCRFADVQKMCNGPMIEAAASSSNCSPERPPETLAPDRDSSLHTIHGTAHAFSNYGGVPVKCKTSTLSGENRICIPAVTPDGCRARDRLRESRVPASLCGAMTGDRRDSCVSSPLSNTYPGDRQAWAGRTEVRSSHLVPALQVLWRASHVSACLRRRLRQASRGKGRDHIDRPDAVVSQG